MSNVDYLLTTAAIRERAAAIYALTLRGDGEFNVNMDKLQDTANLVVKTIEQHYPAWQIPYHSRWNHFKAGGKDRLQMLLSKIETYTPDDKARALFDLVIVSVLLDAGAGSDWHYRDQEGDDYTRSEGLAVASFEMFMQGKFSADPSSKPYQVDSVVLTQMSPETLASYFQVTANNPLSGLAGRAELMQQLGQALINQALDRPGRLYDRIKDSARNHHVTAHQILDVVLATLGPIWPGRVLLEGVNLGDCWQHDGLGEGAAGLVPFHKLSQWLTYSLLEPLEMVGLTVTNLDELTPLAEYRNGGLLIDSGLLSAKNNEAYAKSWQPDAKIMIEWRALTIVLIDMLADVIRQSKGLTREQLPLAKILEGGTWAAGRKLAQDKRQGKPPFNIISDGTVF